jgi:hypothetical protein
MAGHSLSALYRNLTSWFNWFSPYYFKFLFYYSVPVVILAGKSHLLYLLGLSVKPRSPIVTAAIEFVFGADTHSRGGYGGYPPMGM